MSNSEVFYKEIHKAYSICDDSPEVISALIRSIYTHGEADMDHQTMCPDCDSKLEMKSNGRGTYARCICGSHIKTL